VTVVVLVSVCVCVCGVVVVAVVIVAGGGGQEIEGEEVITCCISAHIGTVAIIAIGASSEAVSYDRGRKHISQCAASFSQWQLVQVHGATTSVRNRQASTKAKLERPSRVIRPPRYTTLLRYLYAELGPVSPQISAEKGLFDCLQVLLEQPAVKRGLKWIQRARVDPFQPFYQNRLIHNVCKHAKQLVV
jgi:hypothetical protein